MSPIHSAWTLGSGLTLGGLGFEDSAQVSIVRMLQNVLPHLIHVVLACLGFFVSAQTLALPATKYMKNLWNVGRIQPKLLSLLLISLLA